MAITSHPTEDKWVLSVGSKNYYFERKVSKQGRAYLKIGEFTKSYGLRPASSSSIAIFEEYVPDVLKMFAKVVESLEAERCEVN